MEYVKLKVIDVENECDISTLIDKDVFDRVKDIKWKVYRCSEFKRYVCAVINGRTVYLHQLVLPHSMPRTDHINNDTLDNRRCNLRSADYSQNGANRKINKNNKSGYRGVFLETQTRKWRAQIMFCRVNMPLGRFNTPELAAKAYNDAAILLHGEFASLNEIII